MKKILIIPIAAVTLLYFGCSKSNNSDNGPKDTTPAPVKIEVVSGSGQSDTVGRQLANSVVVKVTQNGNPVSSYSVEFQGSGCNQDLTRTTTTQSDGTASYIWRLAGDVGQQTLKAYALNSQGQKVDSASATGTGITPGPGWHFAACSLQGGEPVTAFCKLSTGRIFTSYAGKSYLRYSDDNGASWTAVKSLGNGHNLLYTVSGPSDEIYVFAGGEGTLYSNDGGQTWTSLSAAPFGQELIQSGIATADGKLVITAKSSVAVSIDKGKTWVSKSASAFIPPNSGGGADDDFVSPTEDNSGNLYVVGRESGTIYKSNDNGNTWAAQPKGSTEQDDGFYVYSTGWFYKIIGGSSDAGLYLSKDDGTTYNKLANAPNNFLEQFSVQSDGNYYFENLVAGLYQSSGLSGSAKLIFNMPLNQPAPYIVAKNNNIVVCGDNDAQIFFYQK